MKKLMLEEFELSDEVLEKTTGGKIVDTPGWLYEDTWCWGDKGDSETNELIVGFDCEPA